MVTSKVKAVRGSATFPDLYPVDVRKLGLVGGLAAVGLMAGCTTTDEQLRLDTRLIAAAWDNDVTRAGKLVRRGADVNAKDDTEQSAFLGPPLARSGRADQLEVVSMIVQPGKAVSFQLDLGVVVDRQLLPVT